MADVFERKEGVAQSDGSACVVPGFFLKMQGDRVEVGMGDKSITGLIQDVVISLSAGDMAPRINISLVPGSLDVMLKDSVLSLKEMSQAVSQRFYTLAGATVYQREAPFPVTHEEVILRVAAFHREHRRMPTVMHVPEAMWKVLKYRLAGQPMVDQAPEIRPGKLRPEKICELVCKYNAEEFKLE